MPATNIFDNLIQHSTTSLYNWTNGTSPLEVNPFNYESLTNLNSPIESELNNLGDKYSTILEDENGRESFDPYNYFKPEYGRQGPTEKAVEFAVAAVSSSINSTISALRSSLSNHHHQPTSYLPAEENFGNLEIENNIFLSRTDHTQNHNSIMANTSPLFSSSSTASDNSTSFVALDEGSLSQSDQPILNNFPENFEKLSTNSRNCVIAYVILFCIGAPGNLFVFISVGREIWRRQLMRSRIKVLIWHLATADLFVTFVVIPIEVFWRLTIQWYGGDVLCKLAQFFRAFGLYLSSMVIICISLDRFFAIVFPLKVIGGMKRVRNMLCVAWSTSILFAAPQILVYNVQKHPVHPSFLLCTNYHYFMSLSKEIMYNLLSLIVMYFAPLLVIVVTYAMVLYTIVRKSREHHQDCRPRSGSNQLRRSDNALNIARARRRTLWLSMLIVTVFLLCWTPYISTTLWYMFDYETADKTVDPRIHEALFVTAVSNSCVNPLLYGNYMKKYLRNLRNAACRSRTSSSSSSRFASSSRNHQHHNHQHHSQSRQSSPYARCGNPNHHFTLSSKCHSARNTTDVTITPNSSIRQSRHHQATGYGYGFGSSESGASCNTVVTTLTSESSTFSRRDLFRSTAV